MQHLSQFVLSQLTGFALSRPYCRDAPKLRRSCGLSICESKFTTPQAAADFFTDSLHRELLRLFHVEYAHVSMLDRV